MKKTIDNLEVIEELVHISEIRNGDCIYHNGKVMTVCDKDIKADGFHGTTIFGDSYSGGRKMVTKVTPIYIKPDLSFNGIE